MSEAERSAFAERRQPLHNQSGGIPMATKYDAIVIGTGQAGPFLAVRLAGTGMKVAIIERKRFGGTCVNNGCIPTKTLVARAQAAQVPRAGRAYCGRDSHPHA